MSTYPSSEFNANTLIRIEEKQQEKLNRYKPNEAFTGWQLVINY